MSDANENECGPDLAVALEPLLAGVYRHGGTEKLYLCLGYARSHVTGGLLVAYVPLEHDPRHRGPRIQVTTVTRWRTAFHYLNPGT